MTRDKLLSVEAEMERLLRCIRKLRDSQPGVMEYIGGTDAAAVRRASLDLTAALAEMRRR